MDETIAAIATPPGVGGIGIVRISGKDALTIGDWVVKTSRCIPVSKMGGYTCAYGRAVDEEGEVDEVVVTVFRKPYSYTGEDVVEIAAHGGIYLLHRVLRGCIGRGARLAGAGEFTKRAFLNGKLDLTKAEAVADLISAQGKQAARAALSARDGALSGKIDSIADKLIFLAAHMAAWIDYPEEELEELKDARVEQTLEGCRREMEGLLKTYDSGKVIREGIDTVIVGKPNGGKSTIMNQLAGRERSIVSEHAGTTRDVVTENIRLGDLMLMLSDTAGIRCAQDAVEQIGVSLAEGQLQRAQLVFAVFDGSKPLDENDWRVMEQCEGAYVIGLVNKCDLPLSIELKELESRFHNLMLISAKEATFIEELQKRIEDLFALDSFDPYGAILANERQRDGLQRALSSLKDGIEARRQRVSMDAVAVCIEECINALLELTGKKAGQEVVNQVFSRFCVGK